MENTQGQLTSPREAIHFGKVYKRSLTRFFAFLTCIAILIAAFAANGVWSMIQNLLAIMSWFL